MRNDAPRRHLLACTAATLAAAPSFAAQAFRVEPLTESEARAVREACRATSLHDEVRQELARALDGRPVPEPLERKLAEAMRCPWCGCILAHGARDHGETGRAPG